MSYLNALLTDLRERKLWPVPLVLIAVLVAVPVLLSKNPVAPHSGPPLGLAIAATQSANSVTVDSTPVQAPFGPGSRDPFTQQKLPGAALAKAAASTSGVTVGSTSTASTGSGSTGSSSTSTGSGGSTGGATTGGATTGGTTTTGTPTTTPPRKSAPAGLAPNEAYRVTLAITTAKGGFNTIDPLQRLSVLPSAHQPLLIVLGVLQGGARILFAVQPGAVVSGPGTCTPGPLDCEILSVAAAQTEALYQRVATGTLSAGMFSVTAVSADDYGSAAAAAKARSTVSPTGRALLAASPLTAPSLFVYDPTVGAVVDERNLIVGGN